MYSEIIAEIRSKYREIAHTDATNIKEAAELLLRTVSADKTGDDRYPLPVVQLLQQMGFGLFRTTFRKPNVSGLIAVDSSLPEKNKVFKTDRVILVNRDDSTAHQRFTIAHELAHYIFDYDEASTPKYYKYYSTDEHTNDIELRANRFAAEILMPTDAFKEKYDQFKQEQGISFSLPSTITKLSQFFDAPVTAVEKRLEETGLLTKEGAPS